MKFLNELKASYPELDPAINDITEALSVLLNGIGGGGTILTCGNGGSAADAEHIVGELMKGFHLKRKLSSDDARPFVDAFAEDGSAIAGCLQKGIAAVSLVSNAALSSAIINDMEQAYEFAQQVYALGRPGDVLIGITTSGNSNNVVNALKVARAMGLKTIALTGQSGGKVKSLADICICVPATRVDKIQELHLPVYHFLCAALEDALFGENASTEISMAPRPSAVSEKLSLPETIELVVFDFDGVFTDNKVYTAQDGTESVMCDRRDGLGVEMLRNAGVPMFILSKESNPVVAARARKLKLDVQGSCDNKGSFLEQYFAENGVDPANVIYMGNDLNDFEAMQRVGFSVAPADSHPDIKRIASLVLLENGGDGAVRALSELILQNTGEL